MTFAESFANGFVLEKRTHLEGGFWGRFVGKLTDADAMGVYYLECCRRWVVRVVLALREMLRQVPQSCGIPSYDGTQHDRSEKEGVVCNEDMMASGPLALQIHPEIGRPGGTAYLQIRIAN